MGKTRNGWRSIDPSAPVGNARVAPSSAVRAGDAMDDARLQRRETKSSLSSSKILPRPGVTARFEKFDEPEESTVRPLDPIRQPNGFTCGPTAALMVGRAVEARRAQSIDVAALGEAAGTNPKTGTTHVEMAKALNHLGLVYRRSVGLGENQTPESKLVMLEAAIRKGRYVLLRTSVGGMFHWVVADGLSDRGFNIACPSTGRTTWTREQTLERWSARNFDCFGVSSDKEVHAPAYQRRPHEMTLQEFTKNAPVKKSLELTSSEESLLQHCRDLIDSAKPDPLQPCQHQTEEFAFFRHFDGRSRSMLAVAKFDPDTVIGCIAIGTTYVAPEYRSLGLGAEMVIAAYTDGPYRYLSPTHFSIPGYATRIKAHRLCIERALAAGLEVSPHVLASNPGTLHLAPAAKAAVPKVKDAEPETSESLRG